MFKPPKLNAGANLQNVSKAENEITRMRINTTFDVKQVVSAVPTHTPKNYYESIVFYVSGATYRVYFYMGTTAGWRYSALT